MSNPSDFVIENGVFLKKYVGPGGDVVVPEGVTSIGDSAFSDCSSLASVTIPEGVTSIGKWAFSGCSSLTCVTIPSSVWSIGGSAFSQCLSLTSVTISEGVRRIDKDAFRGCSSLTGITIPEGVTSIGDGAFSHCSKLKIITIPEGTTNIGAFAFSGCSSLTGITISESVTSIGDCAFSGCNSLKSVCINGSSVKLIKDVFGVASALPTGLVPQIGVLYPHMADGALKQYVLEKKTWLKLDPALRAEIFLGRQGKTVEPGYKKCIQAEELEPLGESIMNRLDIAKPGAKDCTAAAAYMTMFYETAPAGTLKTLYEKLKQCKAGAKALKTVEAHVALMEKLGSAVTVDEALSPAAQKVMAILISEKRNAKDLEKTFQEFYGLSFKELPALRAIDGSAVEAQVLAWLLTAHEAIKEYNRGQPDVVAGYQKVGLRPEAAEIAALLEPASLQAALIKLAGANLGLTGRSKKMFLAYPICRYADEARMAELCARAPKWCSSVSGNDAPPLLNFQKASLYSETRAAMLFAERYHELGKYAELRGVTEDELRDKYLSDVGLDEHGGKAYDLGNQTVTAQLQKDLSFLFELPGGKTAKSLPKKGADPAKYEAANKDFSEMKKSVKKILKSRGKVLFEDFLSGRSRPAADWQDAYLHNPLLREAASLVVWAQGKHTFTLCYGAPIDCTGQPYTITDKPVVVAHPMEMTEADTAAWQKYFTTHGLKQPFAQVWEPVRQAKQIAVDRYKGSVLEIYQLNGKDKHGIHSYGLHAYSDNFGFELDDCQLEAEASTWRLNYDGAAGETYALGAFKFKKYTRKVNHIVTILDGLTVADRVKKDDISVMDLMPGFTLAQITEFIAAAQEANATNVLAALLEHKNTNFADFDPMEEFTLEW